jgi:glycosyltransferase involved in cell wall biosynthesis
VKRIDQSTFAIVANGFAEGPAQALRDYLLANGARRVTTVFHPLVREGDTRHVVTTHEPGTKARTRRIALPVRPPATYPLDLLVPLRAPRVDGWFGFNSLACARGLVERRLGRAGTVVHWCVDFVPDRFGRGPATRVYDMLDSLCTRRADARFELSRAALEGREQRHAIPKDELAPARVVPMGAWLDRVPTTPPDGHERRRVVFLGHLVPRQGVGLLLDALALVPDIEGQIIGRGPLAAELRRVAERRDLSVRFHGFVEDYRDVERLLAESSVAVAPYEPDPESFSRFADPGKLKGYLAAGLPVLLTDVPPNARELAERGGAEIVPYSAEGLATAIEGLLGSPREWACRRAAALDYARQFDWPAILGPALESIGFMGEQAQTAAS